MAKGNIAFGMLKGRIGDVVFSRKRGIQQSRAYVQSPANPQTLSQRGQRVKFGTASAFYRSAVKSLFKFAFEYKLPGESDYNAYIRYNLPDMACNTKSAYSRGLPCVSDWMLSNGTLRSAQVYYRNVARLDKVVLIAKEGETALSEWSVGQLSLHLADTYDLHDGDICTVVSIRGTEEVFPEIEMAKQAMSLTTDMAGGSSLWDIKQFILNFKSTLPAKSLGVFDMDLSTANALVLNVDVANEMPEACGVAVIFSRKTRRGLKVSTARLQLNEQARVAMAWAKSEEWWKFCAKNFDTASSLENEPENILQGSVADMSQYEEVAHQLPWPQQAVVSATYSGAEPVNTLYIEDGFDLRNGILIDVEGDSATYAQTAYVDRERCQQWTGTASDWKIAIGEKSGRVWFIAPTTDRTLNAIYYKGR